MPTAVSLWAFLRPVRNPAAAAPHFRDLQPTKFQNTEEPYMGFNYAAEKKKLEKLGLLKSTQHGNRVKYAVRVC